MEKKKNLYWRSYYKFYASFSPVEIERGVNCPLRRFQSYTSILTTENDIPRLSKSTKDRDKKILKENNAHL